MILNKEIKLEEIFNQFYMDTVHISTFHFYDEILTNSLSFRNTFSMPHDHIPNIIDQQISGP